MCITCVYHPIRVSMRACACLGACLCIPLGMASFITRRLIIQYVCVCVCVCVCVWQDGFRDVSSVSHVLSGSAVSLSCVSRAPIRLRQGTVLPAHFLLCLLFSLSSFLFPLFSLLFSLVSSLLSLLLILSYPSFPRFHTIPVWSALLAHTYTCAHPKP